MPDDLIILKSRPNDIPMLGINTFIDKKNKGFIIDIDKDYLFVLKLEN